MKSNDDKLINQEVDPRGDLNKKLVKILFIIATSLGIILSVLYSFSIRPSDFTINQVVYFYLFIGIFIGISFLVLPARKGKSGPYWYDFIAMFLTISISIYFVIHEYDISQIGWNNPENFNYVLAIIYCLILLEAARRMAGAYYVIINVVIALYPLIADHMPGIFYGIGFPLRRIVGRIVFGFDGIIGVPAIVVAETLFGYLIFAAVLIASGAGEFFLDISRAILGKYRGGPAKVAVISSAFFGSLSGNPAANIVGTGSITIPTMKRMGYSPEYAGAIEACASTGGIVMPPVMGAAAFIMAGFLGVDYAVIVTAAIIPSLLYFVGLLIQVDAYAARQGFKGLPKEEMPRSIEVLKGGWQFLFVIAFMVWGLIYMKWTVYTPFLASILLIIISFFNPKNRITPKRLLITIYKIGELVVQTAAVLLPMAFILVGLVSTGISGAFTSSLIEATGGNIWLILIAGVAACYLLGMAGLVAPAYLFLAVALAPAAIKAGDLNVLGVHLFIVFYSIIGGITPPVAPGAFVAAAISGASPMKTAFTCMRLGVVIYFIPFFFVFKPALILQGSSLFESFYLFLFCVIGIWLIAAGFESYLVFIGKMRSWLRPISIIAGFMITMPEWYSTVIGFMLAFIIIVLVRRGMQERPLKYSDELKAAL